jgi:hypothetical protein
MAKLSEDNKAIESFKQHQQQLEDVNSKADGKIFKTALLATAKKYLGETSDLVHSIESSYLSVKETKWHQSKTPGVMPFTTSSNVFRPENKEIFRKLIEQCIQHIRMHGIHGRQTEKKNWLYNFSNIGLVIAAIPAIGAIWWFGEFCGSRWEKADKSEEFSKLYNDHQILQKNYKDLQIFYDRQKAGKDTFEARVYRGIKIRDREIDSLKTLVLIQKKK